MMKNTIMFRSITLFLLILIVIACQKEQPTSANTIPTVRVLVNGEILPFETVSPVLQGDLILLPIKPILEKLGYQCSLNPQDASLVGFRNNSALLLRALEDQFILDQQAYYHLARPYFTKGSLMVESRLLNYLDHVSIEWDEETNSLQVYDYDQLDLGLYFYGYEDEVSSFDDAVGCQKLVSGQENPFFDPTKPTIIWIHGWQNGGVVSKSRPSFYLNKNGITKHVQNQWINDGWNVAIFHWVQLADELLPYDAESKINAWNNNDVDMRWKKADGSYIIDSMPQNSVATLFAEAYEQLAMKQQNSIIRLAGSSFGGQVALHGSELIKNRGLAPLPDRIALLDIAWTLNYVDNEALYTNEITARAVDDLSPFVPIEYYRTSLLTTLFTPNELIEKSAFQEMVFDYAGSWDIELKHTVITYHYFWSEEHNLPLAYDAQFNPVGEGLSARSSNQEVRQKMGINYHWQHIQGKQTFDPSDDEFERQDGPGY